MNTELVKSQDRSVPEGPDLSALADELVAAARGRGVELTDPGGFLTGLTKRVLETALEVEMADHLGYDRHDPAGAGSGNSRNGSTGKTLRTDVGDVRIAVPRDRSGTFTPAVVPKHSRRLAGFNESVLSLYAKSMTTGDSQPPGRRV
jgi:transposase-like protein